MTQILERLRPWAPTMVLAGLLATLAESLQERDVTSITLILVALLGAALVLPAKRPLNREEVRVEIMTGVRAMVRPIALEPAPPVVMKPLGSGERTLEFHSTPLAPEAPTDPGQ